MWGRQGWFCGDLVLRAVSTAADHDVGRCGQEERTKQRTLGDAWGDGGGGGLQVLILMNWFLAPLRRREVWRRVSRLEG